MSEPHDAGAVLSGLQDILETEHAALKAGKAGEAGRLLQPKMEAMTAFDTLMADPTKLRGVPDVKSRVERIVQLASENAELFSAIRNGIGNAVSRIGGTSADSYVGAYTSAGSRTAFSKATGGYLKKA